MRILGIIPAREGSKRVPQKNFRPFAGTTLTELAIQHALGSNFLTQIALTSDSETVLKIGRAYPQIACLKRPLEISGDDAPA
ncbi:MAG: cytidylyltransferase domain-containing protein, partial [Saprospiraceae bacterium]